ncbi:MXAN_6521/LA_1396 family lipoprotein [Leptospira sp. WS58.C1]|uniref:MXAN_6521/LA_1396 family lipoprotein n=1 Tax=Leptospira cinconiae TaxID=3235173 RepID=UPI00349EAB2D
MRSKFLLLFLISISFVNCAVKQIRISPNFQPSLDKFKRLTVAIDSSSKVNQVEAILVKSMAEQELAHHKEFIVYPDPSSKNQNCKSPIGKSQGVLTLRLEETLKGTTPSFFVWLNPAIFGPSSEGIRISIEAQIQKCDTKEILWEGYASSSYFMGGDEETTLRTSYEKKFGTSVGPKVLPYYDILKLLLDKIESPVLNEAEQDEKIEVESGS